MHWLAQAPANIALIKYMGKRDSNSNLPDNASLSYTLNNLLTTVRLEAIPHEFDRWEPLMTPGMKHFTLAEVGQKRFIDHLLRLKNYFAYSGCFLIQSNNNFPYGSGLASSASSFAALTRCGVQALSQLTGREIPGVEEQARLSRLGSGSSCRSFFTPWALWKEHEVHAINLPYKNLLHQVIVISSQEKKISSSEAHKRVQTSAHYAQRSERAEGRLELLLKKLREKNWSELYRICWDEFQDMHDLFTSCSQPFSYISEDSKQVLELLQRSWDKLGDGPVITMDAGPNIHLLYRDDQVALAEQFKADYLVGRYDVL